MEKFLDNVQTWTEKRLTNRKAKKAYKKKNKTAKSEALDWVDAILFAVVVVFLINQFLFQFFVVPSGSMLETLQLGDRVVVSKLTYGIELYPEGPKILNSRTPDRDDIITFYNPEYESRGSLFNILNQIVFRATFSLVNLDKDENGNLREQLLIKRTAGLSGDTVTFVNGEAYIKLSGEGTYQNEASFREENGYNTAPHTTFEDSTYTVLKARALLTGMTESGLANSNMPKHLVSANNGDLGENADYYEFYKNIALGSYMLDPTDMTARSTYTKYCLGSYVPENMVLPLGDNRDNSGDGRYFGPVSVDSINGYTSCIFWPIKHASVL